MRLQLEEVLVHVAEDADGRAARGHERVNLRRQQQAQASASWLSLEAAFRARACPRITQAPVSLGQSAAWATLTGHTGLGFDLGSDLEARVLARLEHSGVGPAE